MGSSDVSLFFQHFRRDFVARNVTRLSRRDVHRDVFNELLKFFATSDEISFAVYFDQDADFTTHMNVRTDHALCGDSAFFLFR